LSTPPKHSWSVFIFAYNEEKTVHEVITELVEVLRDIANDFEVTVIDDGSTDGTAQAAQQAVAQFPEVRLVRHPVNLGIGKTLADGYRLSTKEIVCGVPADGEFAIQCLRDGARALEQADLVCFYREGHRGPWVRRFLTRSHRVLNRLFLGLKVRDVNWIKIYKRWILDAVPVRSRSPLIETELLAQALRRGARIVELPSPFSLRRQRGGAGLTGTLINGVKMTTELLLFCVRFRWGDKHEPAR